MTLVNFNNKTRNTAPYFNNVFDSLFSEALNKNLEVQKIPGVNILETAENFKIEVAAPGLIKEDFQIKIKKDTLSLWVEKKVAEGEEKAYSRKEFDYTSFARSFVLPETIAASKIEASYVNGVLNITIAKIVESKPEEIEIKVS